MENLSQIGRVYRMNWRGWAFALFILAAGLYSTVGLLTGTMQPTRRFGMFWAVFLLVSGILYTTIVFTTKIVIFDDAIEVRSFFSKRNRLLLSEIRGRRETVKNGWTGITSSWNLEPNNIGKSSIDINYYYTLDYRFYQWLNQIPDLDAEDVPEPCA